MTVKQQVDFTFWHFTNQTLLLLLLLLLQCVFPPNFDPFNLIQFWWNSPRSGPVKKQILMQRSTLYVLYSTTYRQKKHCPNYNNSCDQYKSRRDAGPKPRRACDPHLQCQGIQLISQDSNGIADYGLTALKDNVFHWRKPRPHQKIQISFQFLKKPSDAHKEKAACWNNNENGDAFRCKCFNFSCKNHCWRKSIRN